MTKTKPRPRGKKRFAPSTEKREYRDTNTLHFQRVFHTFRQIVSTDVPRQVGTVENCVRVISRVVDWYLRPGWYGWKDPVKGIRLKRGIVGRLVSDAHGKKKWVVDVQERAEQRAIQILSCMGLLERVTAFKQGEKHWLSNVRYLRINPNIASIMKMEMPPAMSFDAAREKVELTRLESKAKGLKHGEDRFTVKLPMFDVGMADAASLKTQLEIPTPTHADAGENAEEDGEDLIAHETGMQDHPGQVFNYGSADRHPGVTVTPGSNRPYCREDLSSEEERNTPPTHQEPAGKPPKTPVDGGDLLFFEEHHSTFKTFGTGPGEAAEAEEPPRLRPTARIPANLSPAALACLQRSNARNPVLREFYAHIPVADRNAIREIERRHVETMPIKPAPFRSLRAVPPGCESIADTSLQAAATWDGGSAKNSHLFQFLHGAPAIRDWIRNTFPTITELYASDVRHFIKLLYRYRMDFIRCIDHDFVDAKSGVGSAVCLGDIVGRVRTWCRTLDVNAGTTVFLAGAQHFRESGDYLPWKSKNPPTRIDVEDARSAGNSEGYRQVLVRWSKLTPAEMLAFTEIKPRVLQTI